MNIALIGYGKMGHEIEKIARERGHTIVCIIDLNEENKFDSPEFKRADVAIEFTSPQSALQNYRRAFAAGVPVVSGTTGWLEHLDEIKKACQNGGNTFFYASNFSLGVNIFFAVNRYLAKIMNGFPAYDVRLEETHHIHKLDAPSGTAITLAEEILASLDRKREWKLDRVDREDQLLVKAFR
ncbi:MAG TPA: 4-hydroxy-tetrahydrodipicolinate reductase, partial [Porphyromonadaceae bacterium]|nr:4-hydroxy-tetrahydrodipicolinate reductase [Porphyromonadaceae bacterium]